MSTRALPAELGHAILSQSNSESITRFQNSQEIERPSSAPPNLAGEETEVEPSSIDNSMLYSTDYFAYYYSLRPYADARLPVPLLTWEQYSYLTSQRAYSQPKEGSDESDGDSPAWRSASSPSLVDKIQSDFPSTPSNVIMSPILPIATPNSGKTLPSDPSSRLNRNGQESNGQYSNLPYQGSPILSGMGGIGMSGMSGIPSSSPPVNMGGYNQMGYPFPDDSLVSRMGRLSVQEQGKPRRGRNHDQGPDSGSYHPQGNYFAQPGSNFAQPLYPLGMNNMSQLVPNGPQYGPNGSQYMYNGNRSIEQQVSMSPPMYGTPPYLYAVDPQPNFGNGSGKGANSSRFQGGGGSGSSSGGGGSSGQNVSPSKGVSQRSSLLEEFRKKNNKKFEFKDVVGHFIEFSGDQHGSRFIQQKLETCSASEKQLVFKEIYPQCLPLMTDVFGNYVIQKFFEHGTVEHKRLLGESLIGNVLTLSLQMYGCRVIQKALEVIPPEQQSVLVKELEGHVLKCIKDQNGNHVIQKVIETVPEHYTQFIVDTFTGKVFQLATHPYGCRVIQRILEHHSDQNAFERRFEVSGPPPYIVKELLHFGISLVQDQYGNYVIQHLLVHGKQSDRVEIARQVRGKILQFSQHKFASNVIEKCVQYGDDDQRKWLIEEICADPNGLELMMKDQYANYVVQKILDVCDADQREHLIEQIRPHIASLKKYTYGKHIIARLEKLIGKSIT